jgi:sugar lactone lactonase YvrE
MGVETMEQLAQGYDLLEGPVWDPQRGLLFADADGGGVYLLSDGHVSTVVPHRRGIGGMALHAEGGLIVGGRNLAYKGPGGAQTHVLVDNDVAISNQAGFSDIVSSPRGQVYAGTLGSRPDANGHVARGGGLYLLDIDGSFRAVIDAPQVRHTNGLGFSPDGTHLYYADSGYKTVFRYRVNEDGGLSGKQAFVTFDQGIPDGLAVASDGSVWVAGCFIGCVLVYEPTGVLRERIPVPVEIVTNVCFGGDALRDVYITTGSLDPSRKEGRVFHMSGEVPGVPVVAARIPIDRAGPAPHL